MNSLLPRLANGRQAVLLSLIMVMDRGSVFACDCGSPPPFADALENADYVFSGQVTNVKNIDPDARISNTLVEFNIIETFKGELGWNVIVVNEDHRIGCGIPFEIEGAFLVYASGDDDLLHVRPCGRSTRLGKAGDDIVALTAEQSERSGLFTYRVIGETVEIVDYPKDAIGDVEIPAAIDGKPVTSIGVGAFLECTRLTSVTIPKGVSHIGPGAFRLCRRLNNITIPEGVSTIGNFAFSLCSNLKDVTIPKGTTTISYAAFQFCERLTSITIPKSVTSIGELAFSYCSDLSTAVFLGEVPRLINSSDQWDSVFSASASDFTIYYVNGSTGFTSPTWEGYPASTIDSGPILDNDILRISFAAKLPGITLTPETSTNLRDWTTEDITLSEVDADNRRSASIHRVGPDRFMRLVVED